MLCRFFSIKKQETAENAEDKPNSLHDALTRLYPLDNSIINQSFIGSITALALLFPKYIINYSNQPNVGFLPHLSYVTPKNIWKSCVVAPVKEEFIFRGIIRPFCEKLLVKTGASTQNAQMGSILASAALFALTHSHARMAKFVGGVAYGALASRYDDSLWSPTIAHSTNNAALMAASRVFLKR